MHCLYWLTLVFIEIHDFCVQVATLFDDSGIVVRFMNSMTEGNGVRDASAANALLQQVRSWTC